MNSAETIDHVYEQLKAAITTRLIMQGYEPVHEQRDDLVFASRYLIWSNNIDALRLTWDGKEELFLLEVTESLPLSGVTPWTELVNVPFTADDQHAINGKAVIEKVLSSLE